MFETFEHTADIGVRGTADTKEKAFSETAKAMLSVMVDSAKVEEKGRFDIQVKADSLENLLIEFLNEILFIMDFKEAVMKTVKVKEIKERAGEFYLTATGFGEKKKEEHEFMTEVKAATYSQLEVREENGKWIAQCIVDV